MVHTCLMCKCYVPKETKVVGRKDMGLWLEPIWEDVPAHCTKCDNVRKEWFEKYGNLTSKQLTEDMQLPCFELPEYLNTLDSCITLAEEILTDLNKK